MSLLLFWLVLLPTRAGLAEPCRDGDFLRSEARRASIWNWTWGTLYGVAAGVQFGNAALTDDDDTRLDMIVGGGKSVIGTLAIITDPLAVASTASPCSELVPNHLESAAKSEAAKRGWFPHAGTVLLNVGGGLVVGLVDDRWGDAAIQALVGIAVGELQIFTTPRRALDRHESTTTVTLIPGQRALSMGLAGRF